MTLRNFKFNNEEGENLYICIVVSMIIRSASLVLSATNISYLIIL